MNEQDIRTLDDQFCAQLIPHVSAHANKYSRGTLGVVGGCAQYPGAPILASMAAARSGAGYVRLVAPNDAAQSARSHLVSIPVSACIQNEEGCFCARSFEQVRDALKKSGALLVGPGMGTSHDVASFLEALLSCPGFQDRPLVCDADALNIIAAQPDMFTGTCRAECVLTPHEGEAARLLGRPLISRYEDARELASMFNATVVLKGPETLIVAADGRTNVMNSGGPELAKAGTGDVLAGIIAALLAQGLDALDAASLGTQIHANAGKLALGKLGIHAVMPEDIISYIGPAFLTMEANQDS